MTLDTTMDNNSMSGDSNIGDDEVRLFSLVSHEWLNDGSMIL